MFQPKFGNHFGPLLDIAMAKVFLEYINFLRDEQGHPPITWQEFEALALNHESHLNPADWITEDPPP